MQKKILLCVHGYGVRSFFWKGLLDLAIKKNWIIICPNLTMESPFQAVQQLITIIEEVNVSYGVAPILVGHSMGGIISAMTALKLKNQLKTNLLSALVCIACPYGEHPVHPRSFVRFLLDRRLIPTFILKRRFFGKRIKSKDRSIFNSQVVRENEEFRVLIRGEKWFHNELIMPVEELPTLCISSQADRIVPSAQTKLFSNRINSPHIVFQRNLHMGHNDFGMEPKAAELVLNEIERLHSGLNNADL